MATDLLTWLKTKLFGVFIGADSDGNCYYTNKNPTNRNKTTNIKERRWVIYANTRDASNVPALYHAWLHHTKAEFPKANELKLYPWILDHQPNLTGTTKAYRPAGFAPNRTVHHSTIQSWKPKP